jgi:hypothetical protein
MMKEVCVVVNEEEEVKSWVYGCRKSRTAVPSQTWTVRLSRDS